MKKVILTIVACVSFFIVNNVAISPKTSRDFVIERAKTDQPVTLDKAPVITVIDGDFCEKFNTDEIFDYINHINDDRLGSVKPEITKKDGRISVSDYQIGNLVDTNSLLKYVESNSGRVFEINIDDFIVKNPEKSNYASDFELLKGIVAPFCEFKIEYSNGNTIDLSDFDEFITISGNSISVCFEGSDFNNRVSEVVKAKTASYNTYYGEWEFNSHVNGTISIKSDPRAYCSSTYGSKVNFNKEIEYVKNALVSLSSEENRIPYLILDNGFEIPETYIEVSIKDQHLWFYKNGCYRE